PAPERDQGERDESSARGHSLEKGVGELERERCSAEPREGAAGEGSGDPVAPDRDLQGRRVGKGLARRPQAQPPRCARDKEMRDRNADDRDQVDRRQRPDDWPKERRRPAGGGETEENPRRSEYGEIDAGSGDDRV